VVLLIIFFRSGPETREARSGAVTEKPRF